MVSEVADDSHVTVYVGLVVAVSVFLAVLVVVIVLLRWKCQPVYTTSRGLSSVTCKIVIKFIKFNTLLKLIGTVCNFEELILYFPVHLCTGPMEKKFGKFQKGTKI